MRHASSRSVRPTNGSCAEPLERLVGDVALRAVISSSSLLVLDGTQLLDEPAPRHELEACAA